MSTPYSKRQRDQIRARQTDTLVGISKGIIADGVVNQSEAEFLLDWLQVSETYTIESSLISDLYDSVLSALEDGFLDDEEKADLLDRLVEFAGPKSEPGEMIKSAMPVDNPQPPVVFKDKVFKFTGEKWGYGTKKQCEDEVHMRGGHCIDNITRKLDYLVICYYADERWKHENQGTSTMDAVEYREKYGKPAIISEGHFVRALKSTS